MATICKLCELEIKTSPNPTGDPHHLYHPWATPCGHVFHRKCLVEWVVDAQQIAGNPLETADPEFLTNCPLHICTKKFTLANTIPLLFALNITPEITEPTNLNSPSKSREGQQDFQSETNIHPGLGLNPETEVVTLQNQNHQLKDAYSTLGMLAIHNTAELEMYNRKFLEFRSDLDKYLQKVEDSRSDLLGIMTKVNDLLKGFGTTAQSQAHGNNGTKKIDVLALIQDLQTQIAGVVDQVQSGSSNTSEDASDFCTNGPSSSGRLSTSPSISATTIRTFYSATSNSSNSAESQGSASSVRSFPPSSSNSMGRSGTMHSWRQSTDILDNTTTTRKRKNNLWKVFTNLALPGRSSSEKN